MSRPRISCDLDGDELRVTFVFADVLAMEEDDVPEAARAAVAEALLEYEDGQRGAREYGDTIDRAFGGRFGDFGGRLTS